MLTTGLTGGMTKWVDMEDAKALFRKETRSVTYYFNKSQCPGTPICAEVNGRPTVEWDTLLAEVQKT